MRLYSYEVEERRRVGVEHEGRLIDLRAAYRSMVA